MSPEKLRLACFFGGRSSEHEVSIISALQFINSVDARRYDVIPVYIDPAGAWWTGRALLSRDTYKNFASEKGMLQSVTLHPHPGPIELVGGSKNWLGRTKRSSVPFDIAIPIFHGQFGEDGCIQGLFEMAGIPYSGSGVCASALAMNKYLCKQVARSLDVPVLPGVLVNKREFQEDASKTVARVAAEKLSYPVFVKPNNLGSSVGVGAAEDENQLKMRLAAVFGIDSQALLEPCLQEMYELNISVRSGSVASVLEMPIASAKTLTYEDKYLRGGKGSKGKAGGSQGMASLVRVIDPPEIPEEMKTAITGYAGKLFSALGCSGVGRFDFMVAGASGEIYFNELNPLPGSLSFYLWEKSTPRILYPQIVDLLVEEALRSFALKATLKTEIAFRAL